MQFFLTSFLLKTGLPKRNIFKNFEFWNFWKTFWKNTWSKSFLKI